MSINLTDIRIVDLLFEIIYGSTSVNHVTADGKDYYNDECDDSECKFDSTAQIDGPILYKIDTDLEAVNKTILWETKEKKKSEDNEDNDHQDLERYDTIKTIFNNDAKAKLFDIHGVKIRLVNLSGYNDDHRGSNHTAITLDFHHNYELKENTLESLIDALYRIKSHKFDKWYELYCSTSSIVFQEDVVEINISFDHGS